MEENKKPVRMRGLEKTVVWLLMGALCSGMFVLGYFVRGWTAPEELKEIEHILDIIEREYVGDFDRDDFLKAAIDGSLDAYSEYYTPTEYDEVKLSRDGVSKGKIGISFYSGTTVIYSVAGNSPAERAGVPAGGTVVAAKERGASEFTETNTYAQLAAVFEAAGDNEMILRVSSGGTEAEYTLKREEFRESFVWYADDSGEYNLTLSDGAWVLEKSKNPPKTQINEGFAYIRLSSFNGNAYEQIKAALGKMKERGITKLVLDLRNNGGGYMSVLTDIAGLLIPGGTKQAVSVVRYKNGSTESCETSSNSYSDYGFTGIAVLANKNTASASEALIGAMLDYDASNGKNIVKVVVAGEDGVAKTYGKGIMQTTYEFKETGSAIKLTTAEIFWPVSGKSIHGKGITTATDGRVIAAADGSDLVMLNCAFSAI